MTKLIERIRNVYELSYNAAEVTSPAELMVAITETLLEINDLCENLELPNCPVIRSGYELALKEVKAILDKEVL